MKGNKREEKLYPPCKDESCEYYQEWSRVDSRREFRLHCVHPDHPDNPRARPDEKCPKLIEGVGRRLEVEESPEESQSE